MTKLNFTITKLQTLTHQDCKKRLTRGTFQLSSTLQLCIHLPHTTLSNPQEAQCLFPSLRVELLPQRIRLPLVSEKKTYKPPKLPPRINNSLILLTEPLILLAGNNSHSCDLKFSLFKLKNHKYI